METTPSDLWFVVLGLTVLSIISYALFIKRMEVKHRELWVSLGCPDILADHVEKSGKNAVEYLLKFRFIRVGDGLLAMLGLLSIFPAVAATAISLFAL